MNIEQGMYEMKECPFCGSDDIFCSQYDGKNWICSCNNCGCDGPTGIEWSGAVEMWNLRRPYDELEERRNNLELALNDIIKLVELGDKENE